MHCVETTPLIGGENHDMDPELGQTRNLNTRHILMIAIGGTVGTGLFIGISLSLSTGPVTALSAYLFISTICYSVVQSFGEMSVHLPLNGSLCQFNNRFILHSVGSSIGLLYWFSWSMTFALELSVIAQLISYWDPFQLDIGLWIVILWVLLTLANLVSVRFYGEIEFCVLLIKVIAIVLWLVYAAILAFHGPKAPWFKYWKDPGMWGDGILVHNNRPVAIFLAWFLSLVNAAFTFQLIESIAITSGDTKNPHETLPKAIKTLFFRIMVFYLGTLFLLGLLIPYNDPRLLRNLEAGNGNEYVNSLPFVIALASLSPLIASIFDFVILITIILAANSNIYLGSRCLLALSETKVISEYFQKPSKLGVPYRCVLLTSAFGFFALSIKFLLAATVFTWLLNVCASAGLIMWGCICMSHIRFMEAIDHTPGFSRDQLHFKGSYMPFAAKYGLISITCILLFNGFSVFFDFSLIKFLGSYLSLIIFIILWISFQVKSGDPILIPIHQIDLWTGSTKNYTT